MGIVAMCALGLTAAVLALTLRPKNGEISLLLTVACSVMLLLVALGSAAGVIDSVHRIVAASQINSAYIAVLLKVIGICLLTEFTANTCRDAGSSALASNITLAGKLMAAVCAIPLYTDILNTVMSIFGK